MELGSTVCKPRDPDCHACPLAATLPHPRPRLAGHDPGGGQKDRLRDIDRTAVLVRRRQQVLLRRCGPDERWAGLWDFPRFGHDRRSTTDSANLAEQVDFLTGIRVRLGPQLTVLKHAVTRFRITLTCCSRRLSSRAPP